MTNTKKRRMEYLVLWEGYDPTWEAWGTRATGQPGDPFTSWEPERLVAESEALKTWGAGHEEAGSSN